MSTVWFFVLATAIFVWIAGGIFGIIILTNSLGKSIFKIKENGLTKSTITSVIRRTLYTYVIVLSLGLIPWSAVVGTIGSMLDQYFRNTVDDIMSAPDFFEHVSITEEEYASLPEYWRQALAEIALRPMETSAEVKRLIYRLSVSDIKLIDLLAPYWTSIGIIRDENKLSEHPIPDLSYLQILHLESMGILEDINDGLKTDVRNVSLIGHTINLVMEAGKEDKDITIRSTALTRGGNQLMNALRVNSNVEYFEWFAKTLEQQGAQVELYVIGVRKGEAGLTHVRQGQIIRQSLPAWPPSQ